MARPFQCDDLYLFKALDQLSCAAGPDLAAFVVQSVDRDNDGYRSSIWTMPLEGGEARRFTMESRAGFWPRWSPDGGQLAFLSPRDGPLQQVHLLDMRG